MALRTGWKIRAMQPNQTTYCSYICSMTKPMDISCCLVWFYLIFVTGAKFIRNVLDDLIRMPICPYHSTILLHSSRWNIIQHKIKCCCSRQKNEKKKKLWRTKTGFFLQRNKFAFLYKEVWWDGNKLTTLFFVVMFMFLLNVYCIHWLLVTFKIDLMKRVCLQSKINWWIINCGSNEGETGPSTWKPLYRRISKIENEKSFTKSGWLQNLITI